MKCVSHADVQFEGHEARVEYDPSQCRVEDLIATIARAKDQAMPMVQFNATVKKN